MIESAYLAYAQRAQDPHHGRGNRPRVRGTAVNIPHRRAVFRPEFLRISPNNKIPAIVDRNGPDGKPIAIFESGAILIYLAAKNGEAVAPRRSRKVRCPSVADVPDGIGRTHDGAGRPFPEQRVPERLEYAVNRYTKRGQAPAWVMEKRLSEAPYFAGERNTRSPTSRFFRGAGERAKRHRLGGVSQSQEVVRRNRGAPRRATRFEGSRRRSDHASGSVRSESAEIPFRRDAIQRH